MVHAMSKGVGIMMCTYAWTERITTQHLAFQIFVLRLVFPDSVTTKLALTDCLCLYLIATIHSALHRVR